MFVGRDKLGASISVDRSSSPLSAATIALPRASQPFVLPWCRVQHGIRALEATGQVLRFDAGFVCANRVRRVSRQSAPHCSQRRRCERSTVSLIHHPALPGEAHGAVQPTVNNRSCRPAR